MREFWTIRKISQVSSQPPRFLKQALLNNNVHGASEFTHRLASALRGPCILITELFLQIGSVLKSRKLAGAPHNLSAAPGAE